MISVRVLNRQATAINRWPITSGSVGMPVDFIFSSEWDALTKTAIFRGSGESIDVALTDDSCVVPWETLTEAGGDLYIGVYGSNGDDVVIPTVWCNAGYIKEGAMRSEVDPADPTPSWADQVQAIAQRALELAENVSGTVYNVTYGETSVSQIDAAVAVGKIPLLKYLDRWYSLVSGGGVSLGTYTFTCLSSNGTLYWAKCELASVFNPTGWTSGSVDLNSGIRPIGPISF